MKSVHGLQLASLRASVRRVTTSRKGRDVKGGSSALSKIGLKMERTARCHCGALAVTAIGEPAWVNLCHCKACQRRTGAVFHCGAYFENSRVRIEGSHRAYARAADSGYEIRFHFCPTCGSNVYWQASRFPKHCGIAVGA